MAQPYLPIGRGPIFTAAFTAASVSSGTDNDLFSILAPSNSRVAILEVSFGQYSQFGDAKAGVEGVKLFVGSTASAAGSGITPNNVDRHAGFSTAAGSSVVGPSSGVGSTTSAVLMRSEVWNVAANYLYMPQSIAPQCALILKPSERMLVRLMSPNEALTMNGTLTFQEIGL